MRSALDVTLLGMWVPDSASPSSAPPTPIPRLRPPARARRGLEHLTRAPRQEATGEEGANIFGRPDVHLRPLCLGPCQARGCTEVTERQWGEPFHGSCVGGTLLPPTECFPSAEGLCGHSQASFPSKLERAMAKACRAHSGYR